LPIFAAIGAAAGAGGYYYMSQTGAAPSVKEVVKPPGPATPVFKGGDQGFVDLKLASIENVNHNTKRFRFEFPEGESNVSGLHIACTLTIPRPQSQQTNACQLPFSQNIKAPTWKSP
jgi:cytochrome-b5 reductase